MRYLLIALLAIFGMGCATMDNANGPATVQAANLPAGSGVMLMSAGAQECCVSFATLLKLYRRENDGKDTLLRILSVDGYVMKSDFATHQGNVHAVALEEGEYILEQYAANPYTMPVVPPRFAFTVTAGQVVYIGEYFMTRACDKGTHAVIRDQGARDLAIAASRNPGLARLPVVTRLAVRARID